MDFPGMGSRAHDSGHGSLLQMLLRPQQGQRHEGPSMHRREPSSLVRFVTRQIDDVAVGQPRSSELGDICDKEAESMGGSPIEGPRLFPDLRLGPHLPTAQGSSVAVGEEGQTPHSEDQWVDSSPEFQEGTRAPTPETPISPHTPHGKPGRSRSPSSLKRTLFEGMSSFLKPGNNQPWWKSLLASPARRLAANHPQAPPVAQGLGKLELPVSASRVKKRRPSPHAGANAPKARAKAAISKRKDLPKSRSTANNMSKPSLRNAIAVMKSKNTMKAAMKEVENDYFANSSRVARSAKRHAVKSILETAFSTAMPLSPAKLQALAGALRTSGYKSAHTYLVEAKIYHVEKGWKWSHLLDRHFKLCVKAVKRGMGPAKKAPEVAADLWKSQPLLPDSESTSGKVLLAGPPVRVWRPLDDARDRDRSAHFRKRPLRGQEPPRHLGLERVEGRSRRGVHIQDPAMLVPGCMRHGVSLCGTGSAGQPGLPPR